jgi:hypothetical protein
VKGWIDKTLAGPDVPAQVAFAYVDFDFYDPIRLALAYLARTMPAGGFVVVDDYGFFSEGAQLAVDEFVEASPGSSCATCRIRQRASSACSSVSPRVSHGSGPTGRIGMSGRITVAAGRGCVRRQGFDGQR